MNYFNRKDRKEIINMKFIQFYFPIHFPEIFFSPIAVYLFSDLLFSFCFFCSRPNGSKKGKRKIYIRFNVIIISFTKSYHRHSYKSQNTKKNLEMGLHEWWCFKIIAVQCIVCTPLSLIKKEINQFRTQYHQTTLYK